MVSISRDRGGYEGVRVLIVDDEPSICKALQIALKRAGFDPTIAQSGDAALDKLRSVQFDAMIVDLRMPDLAGVATVVRVRAIDEVVPIIAISDANPLAFGNARALGVSLRLGSSFSLEELWIAIRWLLAGRPD